MGAVLRVLDRKSRHLRRAPQDLRIDGDGVALPLVSSRSRPDRMPFSFAPDGFHTTCIAPLPVRARPRRAAFASAQQLAHRWQARRPMIEAPANAGFVPPRRSSRTRRRRAGVLRKAISRFVISFLVTIPRSLRHMTRRAYPRKNSSRPTNGGYFLASPARRVSRLNLGFTFRIYPWCVSRSHGS